MSEWTTDEECKRLRACFDQVLGAETIAEHYRNRHAEGALCCIRAIQCDPRELLDALEEAETRRNDALAKKRVLEDVAASFGWEGSMDLATWAAIQARMAREHGELLRQIEAVARAHGYDAVESEESVLECFERICRERDEARAAGFHVGGCYAHVEREPDDVEPRCVPDCPTATAQRALGDEKAQP